MRKRTHFYRLHKPTGQAFVQWQKSRIYLGKHGTFESWERYVQFLVNNDLVPDQRVAALKEEIEELERVVAMLKKSVGLVADPLHRLIAIDDYPAIPEGFVYFGRAALGGLVKIGKTRSSLSRRRENYEAHMGCEFIVFGLLPGADYEKDCHIRFDHLRAYGEEWFLPDKELFEFVERHCITQMKLLQSREAETFG